MILKPLNRATDVTLCLKLSLAPEFCVNSEDSGQAAQMRRLAWTFTFHILLMRHLFEGVFFMYHHAVKHPHTNIIMI